MEINVKKETLKVTDKCRHNFNCLEGNGECLCPVTKAINGTICVLEKLNDFTCEYHTKFADDHFCMCPTRNEIFRRFKR